MPGRVSSPQFIGRRSELARLAAAVEDAAAGRGTFLLVSGEAGVGKTRFVEETVARARGAGAAAAVGGCLEFGAGGLSFAAFRSVLRQLGAAPDELAPIATDIRSASAMGEPIGVGADSSQVRLFEACMDVLRTAGHDRGLLVVIEDVHWADPSTLDLLRFLAHDIHAAPVVIAATFRSDDLHRRHPLQSFLGEVQRARSSERIDLARFLEEEIAEQVEGILGEPVEASLVRAIHRRSDGNAFYAEELVAAELSGDPIPPLLRDVLLARIATLTDRTQELLRVVAAGGTRVATAVVRSVAVMESDALDACVREAVERHLLLPTEIDGDEHLAFRHALVQEAVYGELLPGERVRLHSRYGQALSTAGDPKGALSTELAHHWYASHDLPRALVASIDAGEWAERRMAFADAQMQYERALELWDLVPDAAERTGVERIDLLQRAATAASATNPPRAAALMEEAIVGATNDLEPTRAGLLRDRFARFAWMAGDGIGALEAARLAVELVPESPPSVARARVLATLGQILVITLSPDAWRVCKEAIAIAQQIGALAIECHALNSLATSNVYMGHLEVGLQQLRESLAMAIRLGLRDETERARGNIVDVLGQSGRFADAGDEAVRAYEFAKQHGLPQGVIYLTEGALAYYRLGRWVDAQVMLERAAQEAVSGVPVIVVEQRRALLMVGMGEFEQAAQLIAGARSRIGRVLEGQAITPLGEAAAELALWGGRPLDARHEIAATRERVPALPGYISRLSPLLALGARAEADVSELARARSDDAALAESIVIVDDLLATMRRLRDAALAGLPNFLPQAEAWLAACEAERLRGTGRNDAGAWHACALAFEAIPMAYPRAYALWREAEAELGHRRRSAATEPLQLAFQIVEGLAARPLAAQISALAERAGITLGDGQLPLNAVPARDEFGLTPREHEILRLVAAGRTNREIAESLFISEGTAGTHVSNILGKLGVHGRTEAASLAHRLGLVAD